jgi:hypothetical protein
MASLPVVCYAKNSVWVTSEIFKKWPMSLDLKLQKKLRKILLVLDNCAAQTYLHSL